MLNTLSTNVISFSKIDVEVTVTFGLVSKIISVSNFVLVNKYVLFSSSTIFSASGLDKVKFKVEVTQGHVSHIQLLNSSIFPCKTVSR